MSEVGHPYQMLLRLPICISKHQGSHHAVHVAGKDLFSLVERQRLSEPNARFYIAEIALALGHMHHYNFIYRDLKSENVMLAMDGHLKLIDLGFARHCPRDSLVRGDFCGTCARSRPRSECILCFELQA